MTPDEEAAKARGQVTPLGPGVVDRSAFNYGGDPAAAGRESGALAADADAAQRRQGEQINLQNPNEDRNNTLASRGKQLGIADMMARRASGQTPSIAGMVGDRDMGRVAAEGSSAAASARGPAAMALAQQGAAANTAAGQSAISNSTQINSANERLQAEQAASGAYTNLRSGDAAQQGQDFSQSAAQAQLNAQQRAQNDAYATNTRQQGIGIQSTQLGADMNRDAAEQAGHFNAVGVQQAKDAANDANVLGYVSAGAQAAASVAPLVASDERTKVPVTWGGGEAAPADAPATWGSGAGTNAVDSYRSAAARALSENAAREASTAATSPRGVSGGPMAVDMNPGKRWDSEDLGLIQAKQRNGVDLTDKEESSKASLQHRAGQDKLADATKKDGSATAKDAPPKPTLGEQVGSASSGALSGIGKALGNMSANKRGQELFRPQAAQTYAMPSGTGPMVPMVTTSDDHAKVAAAWDEGHAAAVADVQKLAHMSPQDLKAHDQPLAQAVRGVKADAWDEGHKGPPPGLMAQRAARPSAESPPASAPKVQPAAAERPAAMSRVEREDKVQPGVRAAFNQAVFGRPSSEPITDADMAMSDERTKVREDVGTLGKEMPHNEMAEAARSMRAVPYAYKEQFAGQEGQAPGEVNVGPVAQEMQKSKVAATAVKTEPNGMRGIDIPKYTKVLGGIAADQQEQLDDQKRQISMMAKRLGGRR